MISLQGVILVGVVFGGIPSIYSDNSHKIASDLTEAFGTEEGATKDIVITFKDKPSKVLNMFDMTARSGSSEIERVELHQNFMDELKLMTKESQSGILKFLEGEAEGRHESFWVSNQIFVKGASKELAEAVASFDNVEMVHEEKIYHIHRPVEEGPVIEESRINTETGINADIIEWNVEKIHAPEVWQQGKGATCTVGVIDTGVRISHEAFGGMKLAGWRDAVNKRTSGYDDNGHGTHVTATIAGVTGTGVAGGFTRIVACKACTGSGSCSQSTLTDCCQFMTEQHPNVISNSWGGPSGSDATYTQIINSWRAMNIFVVFSAGNSGPNCGTVGSPGDYVNVVSVGSTNSNDALSSFSSRGQTLNGMVAPTVSAPGENIKSAWMTSNTAYKAISGTSMAAPHVAGMYALMYTHNPGISFDQAKAAIINSCATSGLADPKQTCGGTSANSFPNNMFGNGRIDCMNGLKFAQSLNIKN